MKIYSMAKQIRGHVFRDTMPIIRNESALKSTNGAFLPLFKQYTKLLSFLSCLYLDWWETN